MPASTGDFSKSVGDLLGDDFGSKKFVKTKFATAPVNGSAITFTTEATEKGGKLGGKVSAKWKHKASGFSLDKVALDPKDVASNVDFSVSKLPVAGLTVKCKTVPASKSGSVAAEYNSDALYAGLLVKASKGKYDSATADATMAYDGIQVGGKVSFAKSLGDTWVGIGYSTKQYFAAISADNMSSFTLDAMVKPTSELTVACSATSDLQKKTELAAVGAYKVNSDVSVKGKYSMAKGGALDCAVSYSALPKVCVVGGLAIPLAGGDKSYGLGLTLG
jgi:hypothetical protein